MNITEKAIVVSGLVFLYIGVALSFGSCLNRKHKTVEPDYVSDTVDIYLLNDENNDVIPEGDYTSTINIPEGVTCIILHGIRKIKINKSNNYRDDIDFPDSADPKTMIYENTTENSGLIMYDSNEETVEQYLRRFGIEKGFPWLGDGDNGD
jgi:hypothetical protein